MPLEFPDLIEAPEYCRVCTQHPDKCICPPCPICKVQGNPKCYLDLKVDVYNGHGMKLSYEQHLAQTYARIEDLEMRLADEYTYLDYIKSRIQEQQNATPAS